MQRGEARVNNKWWVYGYFTWCFPLQNPRYRRCWRLLRTHGSISNECFMNSLLHHCYKRGTDYVRLKPDLQSGKFFFQCLVRPSLLMRFNTESYQANFEARSIQRTAITRWIQSKNAKAAGKEKQKFDGLIFPIARLKREELFRFPMCGDEKNVSEDNSMNVILCTSYFWWLSVDRILNSGENL